MMMAVPILAKDIERLSEGLRAFSSNSPEFHMDDLSDEDVEYELMAIVQYLMNRHLEEGTEQCPCVCVCVSVCMYTYII